MTTYFISPWRTTLGLSIGNHCSFVIKEHPEHKPQLALQNDNTLDCISLGELTRTRLLDLRDHLGRLIPHAPGD